MVQLKDRQTAHALSGDCRLALIKVVNVFQEQISVIDLNHYRVLLMH